MIPVSEIKSRLSYDRETGVLVWRPAPEKFASKSAWDGRFSGAVAGSKTGQGYIDITIGGKHIKAHRAAWAIAYGEWPEGHIDHINGIRDDNRLSNLRCVSPQDNQRNLPTPKNNTSGHIGVCRVSKSSRWEATIWFNNVKIRLGSFERKEDAIAARKMAERRFGFHKNHGRLSNGVMVKESDTRRAAAHDASPAVMDRRI